jgi:hypothetical protein
VLVTTRKDAWIRQQVAAILLCEMVKGKKQDELDRIATEHTSATKLKSRKLPSATVKPLKEEAQRAKHLTVQGTSQQQKSKKTSAAGQGATVTSHDIDSIFDVAGSSKSVAPDGRIKVSTHGKSNAASGALRPHRQLAVKGSKDDLFGEMEASGKRKKTEEGWNIYSEVCGSLCDACSRTVVLIIVTCSTELLHIP